MSKGKSRSVKSLPKTFQKYPTNEYITATTQEREKTPTTLTSESDIDSITLDLNKLGGLSSSSSLSWSDEYESETTKKVHEELRRIDRVLQRKEPIPFEYDTDEFEQWIKLFPNVSIFDEDSTPVNSTQNIFEDLITEDSLAWKSTYKHNIPKKDCDILSSTKNNKSVIYIKDAQSNKLLEQRSARSRKRSFEDSKNRNLFPISNKPSSLDTDRYLKISPMHNKTNYRKLSSKSTLSRQTSKEYSESTLEFNSLPFIDIEDTTTNMRTKPRRKFSKPDIAQRRSNRLILPPIENDQFRSISATPRHAYKTFSALSVKSNFIPSSIRKLSNSLPENSIHPRIKHSGFVL